MRILGAAVLTAAVPALCTNSSARERTVYEPTWESLDQHQTPAWLMDAKFGLFIYPPDPTREEFRRWHEKHGHLPGSKAHAGDKPPPPGTAWNEVTWDADALAQLAVDAGARYVVFCAGSRGFFVNHPSRFADTEGSPFVRMGPEGRDYVGEIAAAVRARGLRFGMYTNYIRPEHHPLWIELTQERIDRYQPLTLWFDGDKLAQPAEKLRSRDLLAYYYNHSGKQDQVAAEDAMGSYKRATWGLSLDHGDFYRKEMSPPHDDISEGYFIRYETVYRWRTRSPVGASEGLVNNMVEWLVDATAKNGNLELAIHIAGPELTALQDRALLQIGHWLQVNGEAIYESRPWREGSPQGQTPSGIHVRYTVKDDSLYAILFSWPKGKPVLPHLRAAEGTSVRMLGVPVDLGWTQTEQGLSLDLPPNSGGSGYEPEIPCDHAFVYKISPHPGWVE